MDNNKLFTDQHEVVKHTMLRNLARQNTILLQLENVEEEVVKNNKTLESIVWRHLPSEKQ